MGETILKSLWGVSALIKSVSRARAGNSFLLGVSFSGRVRGSSDS